MKFNKRRGKSGLESKTFILSRVLLFKIFQSRKRSIPFAVTDALERDPFNLEHLMHASAVISVDF